MKLSESEKRRLKTKYGSWAIVTGASSGIGKEIAERLAEAGLNLFLTSRRKSLLEELAVNLESRYGIETRIVAADLSKTEEIYTVINKSKDLDIGLLVAAAGFGTSGLFINSNLEEELNMLQVNCTSLTILTHYFSKSFTRHKKGGIILMSSLVGFQGVPYAAHYAATKAYVQSLAEALTIELKTFGVDVLAVAPAPVYSGFAERANMKMSTALKPSNLGIPILKALGRKSVVLPGFLSKFLINSLKTVPRWAKVKILKIVMGGMTKHQRNETSLTLNP